MSTTSVAVLFPTSFIPTAENSSQVHSATPSGAVTSTNVFIVAYCMLCVYNYASLTLNKSSVEYVLKTFRTIFSMVSFEPLTATVIV